MKINLAFTLGQIEVLKEEAGNYMTPALKILLDETDDDDFIADPEAPGGYFLIDILVALTSATAQLVETFQSFDLEAQDLPITRYISISRIEDVVHLVYASEDLEVSGEIATRETNIGLAAFTAAAADCVEEYLELCRELNPNYEIDEELLHTKAQLEALKAISDFS